MEDWSSARAAAPCPRGATAKFASSSGESAETKVSTACPRRGVVPRIAAAPRAPSSPISSRVLQMKITRCFTAARLQLERAVVADRRHPEADLVQVRDDHDHRITLADPHPQVARRIGLALRPRGQETLHGFPYRRFGLGDAVGLDEGGENGLGFGDTVLGG